MKKFLLTLLGVFVMGLAMAQQGNHWSPISGTQYNMTVKGVIVIDGIQQANNMLEIGAFCGDECRGSRKATLFPPTGDYIVTLAIVSNVVSGETITFRIYDHDAQQELELESLSTLIFADNTNVGDPTNWFQIAFATPTPPAFHFTTAGNWSNVSNWEGGALPGESDAVFIDANCILDQDAEVANLTVSDGYSLALQSRNTLTVTGELVNTEESGLIIEDGAQLINASTNVKATAEKDIVAYGANNPDGWYAIASPMDEMLIENSDFLTERYDLYRFNETRIGEEWENYKDDSNIDFDVFENGRGYLYANSNTFSPAFTGTLNYEACSISLTYSDRPDGLRGFNLIGNPFSHAIYKGAGGAIDNANLASGYYTLNNEGAWHVHTYEDPIMPGQGILIKTTIATNLSISKSNTPANAESNGAKAAAGRLRISVTGNGEDDCAFVYFSQGFGLNKMDNFSEQVPSLWVHNDGNDYAIAHVSNVCESLDLYFKNRQNGDFILSVNVRDTNFSYLQLIDNVAGTVVDLQQQPYYSFHDNGQEALDRFKLVFKVMTGVEERTEAPFAFFSDGTIIISDVDNNATIRIVDALGRVVVSQRDTACTVSTEGMSSGVYVLWLVSDNIVKSQKIIIP